MDIIKLFKSNTNITICGTEEDPLFRASDIGTILEMNQINSTIRDFDETERVMLNIQTPGGSQKVTFLTEKGLYEILFKSRKPIAKEFKNWIFVTMREIRLNNKYENGKMIIIKNEEIAKKDKELKHIDDRTYLKNNDPVTSDNLIQQVEELKKIVEKLQQTTQTI